jgi:hypothetical protein
MHLYYSYVQRAAEPFIKNLIQLECLCIFHIGIGELQLQKCRIYPMKCKDCTKISKWSFIPWMDNIWEITLLIDVNAENMNIILK